MVPSTGKRNFCIRRLKVMLSFDKVILIQDVGKDSNSMLVYYLSTGLCGPWQLQISLYKTRSSRIKDHVACCKAK